MTIIQSPTGGEAAIFTWLADKVLGGAKRALGWGWDQKEWAKAQDRYDQQIIRDYGEIRIFGQTDPKPLRDIFTDVFVLDRPTAFRRFDPETLATHLWSEDRGLSFRHGERQPGQDLLRQADKFVILGKPGAGKTTFLKYLAVREAQRGAWGDCLGKIAIFVPLRQLAEKGQTPDDLMAFIVDQFAICHFPDAAPFVDKLLREGKALVLFDGLDEVPRLAEPQPDDRGSIALTLERFARQYDRCHIIITSRIAATEYTFHSSFTYLELADFAPEQVDVFVRNWFWDKKKPDESVKTAEQMLKELEQPEQKGIRDLTRNPLLLTLLCLSYAETLSFPARRVEIYQEATQALLKKWDSSRQIRRGSLYKTLSLGRKEQMFARIAWDGFVSGSVLFSQDDLAAQLTAYLQHVPEMPATVDIDGETVLLDIVAKHGIFTEQAYHQFSFAHLTFQEYYAARYAVDNAAAGTLEALAEHFHDPKWREVLLLTASMLPDASRFLSHYLNSLESMVQSRPRLTAWLWWIDESTAGLQVAYRRPAMRLFIARDLVLTFDLAGSYTRELVRSMMRPLALGVDPELAAAVRIDLEIGHAREFALILAGRSDRHVEDILDSSRTHMVEAYIDRSIETAQLAGQFDLGKALSDLDVPDARAHPILWREYAKKLQTINEDHIGFQRYWQLQSEASTLVNEQTRWRSSFDPNDIVVMINLVDGTNQFYECLQLGYVPDRRAFEDRIFVPPP